MKQDDSVRVKKVLGILKKTYPHPHCILTYKTPWQLLVAVQLSAQCTDVMVNTVTPALFKHYPTVEKTANAPIKELERLVHSTGFYRNKAKHIKAAAQMIVAQYDGRVPRSMVELLKLPGIARKTANVILGNAFGIVEGIAVDTHVARISQRLALTHEHDPKKIEKDLMNMIPRREWFNVTYRIIDHGRTLCKALKPLCGECPLKQLCPSSLV